MSYMNESLTIALDFLRANPMAGAFVALLCIWIVQLVASYVGARHTRQKLQQTEHRLRAFENQIERFMMERVQLGSKMTLPNAALSPRSVSATDRHHG